MFTAPVQLGALARFDSKVVYTGKSKITVFIKLSIKDMDVVKGFITFVNVDKDTKPLPHGVTIVPETDEEKELFASSPTIEIIGNIGYGKNCSDRSRSSRDDGSNLRVTGRERSGHHRYQ